MAGVEGFESLQRYKYSLYINKLISPRILKSVHLGC